MKIRLLFTLAALAIGLATPTLAQLQNTVDPEVRQEIEAVTKGGRRRLINMTPPLGLPSTPNSRSMSGRFRQKVQLSVCQLLKKSMRPFLHLPPDRPHSRLFRYMPSPIKYVRSWTTLITMAMKGQNLVIYVYVPDAEGWKVRLSYGLLP